MTILILLPKGKLGWLMMIAVAGVTAFAIFSPQSYLHEKVDRQVEFMTNFDRIFVNGGIVQTLSSPKDTLFLDGWDDLIYFQAQRYSPYIYSWYTSSMWQFEKFQKAREEMFRTNPPTFYYGKCSKNAVESFPRSSDYIRLVTGKDPTCMFVLKTKLPEITAHQWTQAAEKFGIITPNVQAL